LFVLRPRFLTVVWMVAQSRPHTPQFGRAFSKDSVLVFENGQPLRKVSELLFEKKLLIPALRQLVSSHRKQRDG
jgi:hypothetical protein